MNAYYQIAVFICLAGMAACHNQKEDSRCADLKKGKYEFHSNLGPGIIYIERNDSIQTEKSSSGISIHYRIAWPSPCVYTLKFHSFANEESKKSFGVPTIHETRTEIKNITGTYYIAETTIEGDPGIHSDTILIVK